MYNDGDTYQPVIIPLPANLRQKLLDDTTDIQYILNQGITFRLLRTSEPTMIAFLTNHIDSLLKLAFDPDADAELSAKAFAILEHSQETLTNQLLAKQRLHNTACFVLAKPDDLNPIFVNRLASLTLNAIYIDPVLVTKSCGFILQLISFIAEPSILSLFESICAPDEDIYVIQKWLISMGFTETLCKELDDFPDRMEQATLETPKANYLVSLLRIVTVCGMSPILGPKVCNYSFVTALNRTVGNYPLFVENQRWEAIAALYCPDTHENMRGFFPHAIEIITDPTRANTRSSAAAVDLLAVMIQFDPDLNDFMVSMNVAKSVLDLATNNPDATLLHLSCIDFIKAALENDKIRPGFVPELIKVLLVTFRLKNKCLKATFYKLIKLSVKLSKQNPKIAAEFKKNEEFLDMLKGPLTSYRILVKYPYGGALKLAAADDIGYLAQKAIENIGL